MFPHPLPPLPPQLNGTQVESVQLKVSIARKQPMLDAATGKSVWGSLGKNRASPPSPWPLPHSPFVSLRVPGFSRGQGLWEAVGMGRRAGRPSASWKQEKEERKGLKTTSNN